MTDKTAHEVTNEDRRRARDWAWQVEADPDAWTERLRVAARVILVDIPAPTPPTTAKENPEMPDQTIPADKVREIIARWRDGVSDRGGLILDDLKALLPAPPPPTLADMTPEEQGKHVGGQVDVSAEAFGGRAILTGFETATLMGMEFPRALILTRDCRTISVPTDEVTPLPDLPRLEWPGDKKPDPAPALPDGWRLADHEKYGRVIVTNTTPDAYGDVCFVAPAPGTIGNDWHLCDPAELTYLDQEADQ